jgi:hypothetical protein
MKMMTTKKAAKAIEKPADVAAIVARLEAADAADAKVRRAGDERREGCRRRKTQGGEGKALADVSVAVKP